MQGSLNLHKGDRIHLTVHLFGEQVLLGSMVMMLPAGAELTSISEEDKIRPCTSFSIIYLVFQK